jgi:hypothetical protein
MCGGWSALSLAKLEGPPKLQLIRITPFDPLISSTPESATPLELTMIITMKTYLVRKIAAASLCLGIASFAVASPQEDSVVTAVFSRSFNSYERPTRADGSDQPLTYVIANGGYAAGTDADRSIEDVKFAGIVRVLGKFLAKQAYYPAKDAKKADLMLVVHWGKTKPFSSGPYQIMQDQGLLGFATLQQQLHMGIGASPGIDYGREAQAQVKDPVRDALIESATEEMVQGLTQIRFAQDARIDANRHNANLLGYTAELKYRNNPTLFAGAGTAYDDLFRDLEAERYDFQEALQHRTNKGLWRTVASIDARGNRFDERLLAMIDKASRYFGRDSGRLIRQFQYTPHIDLGELKTLGVIDQTPSPKR